MCVYILCHFGHQKYTRVHIHTLYSCCVASKHTHTRGRTAGRRTDTHIQNKRKFNEHIARAHPRERHARKNSFIAWPRARSRERTRSPTMMATHASVRSTARGDDTCVRRPRRPIDSHRIVQPGDVCNIDIRTALRLRRLRCRRRCTYLLPFILYRIFAHCIGMRVCMCGRGPLSVSLVVTHVPHRGRERVMCMRAYLQSGSHTATEPHRSQRPTTSTAHAGRRGPGELAHNLYAT